MSTRFTVDPNQLRSTSAYINRLSGTIEQDVAQLMSVLRQLDSTWQGSAASGFHSTVGRWSTTQRQVKQALDEINAALARATSDYEETERRNSVMFS